MTDTRATVSVRMAIRGNVIERYEVDDVIDIVSTRLKGGIPRGLAVGSVNLDHLHHFGDDGALGLQPGPEWLLLADGMPIAWRGQMLTSAPWPRVTGADMLPRILKLAEQGGYRIGFLGGTTETLASAMRRLAEQHPNIKIAGTWSPDAAELETRSTQIAAEIRAARTEILVVSLGKPRQERWIVQFGTATGADVFLPFGAAIDFFAGTKRRAPRWMQRLGLEWFYRLSREPRRLARRYLIQGPSALIQAARAKVVYAPGVYYATAPTSPTSSSTSSTSSTSTLPEPVPAGERRAVGADPMP